MRVKLVVQWVAQGKVNWNPDWTADRGYTKDSIPGLLEHVSFVNFDLASAGLPTVQRDESGQMFMDVDLCRVTGYPANAGVPILWDRALARIDPVLQYHGFTCDLS